MSERDELARVRAARRRQAYASYVGMVRARIRADRADGGTGAAPHAVEAATTDAACPLCRGSGWLRWHGETVACGRCATGAPVPDCLTCNDGGWLGGGLSGEPVPCPHCEAAYREPSPVTGEPRRRSEDW